MIRVRRPEEVPARLAVDGGAEARGLCAAIEASPTAWMGFEFKAAVYGHDSVRQVLLAAQHHKCAFCERRISVSNEGDVEHCNRPGLAVISRRPVGGSALSRLVASSP